MHNAHQAAFEQLVRQGKALYVGISNYSGEAAARSSEILRRISSDRVPLTIHQPKYNMLLRGIETDLLPAADEHGFGIIVFSPLAQGLLTGKYLKGIPSDSRAARDGSPFLSEKDVTPKLNRQLLGLKKVADARGQSLAQMAISWTLRDARVTSALVGARTVNQLEENIAAADNLAFPAEELVAIEMALSDE